MFKFLKKLLTPAPETRFMDWNRIRKSAARLEYNIAKCEADKYYHCGSGDECCFTQELIDFAKSFVKDQEENNPDWQDWVKEWENGYQAKE